MDELTVRQTDILRALIKEYSETGEPVGSEILEKKYKLGVSPATVRNEMVELAKKGYIKKDYFSSGRIPSANGFRFYIKNLMKEKEVSTTDEVAYKNSIWDEKDDLQRLLSHATKILAQKTGMLSLTTTDSGDLYYAGVGNLLALQEFLDWNLASSLFDRLDELTFWGKVLDRVKIGQDEVYFLMGEEDFSDPAFELCASIFGEFEGKGIKGMIGVVGPKRMYYDVLTPQVKYFSGLLDQIIKEEKK